MPDGGTGLTVNLILTLTLTNQSTNQTPPPSPLSLCVTVLLNGKTDQNLALFPFPLPMHSPAHQAVYVKTGVRVIIDRQGLVVRLSEHRLPPKVTLT